MHILPKMTEEKLAPSLQKPRGRRVNRLVLAALALLVAALVLFRQSVGEGIGQIICAQQNLTCKLRISRLDFGGLTFRELDVRGPKSPEAALKASRVAIDLDWSKLFSPRARWVGGDEIVMRLDLSGTRPLLGDLDQAVKNFTKGGGDSGPIPRLDFTTLKVIGETPLGPVEAHGAIAATGPDAFVLQLTAPPAKMGLFGASLQLQGGDLKANVSGGEISAHGKLDLTKFETKTSHVSDVKIELSLDQSSGTLKGAGSATVGKLSTRDAELDGAEAQASVESAAVDPAKFDAAVWLSTVRRLDLSASAGEGAFGSTGWTKGDLKALITPQPSGGSAGDISFIADGLQLEQGSVGKLEATGKVTLPKGGLASAQGVINVRNAALSTKSREELSSVVSAPFEAILPGFATSAAQTMDRAGRGFEVVAPWSAHAVEGGFDVSAMTGVSLRATSGFVLTVDADPGHDRAVTFSTAKGGNWNAAGALRISGGGGPDISLDLAHAAGAGPNVSIAGAAKLSAWRHGQDVLAAEASGLQFDTTDAGGSAGGQFTVRLDGAMAGGVWKAVRSTGEIKSAWTHDSFYADAPKGLVVQWDEARYGDNVFGAGALHYAPKGRLAERQGDAVAGQGTFAEVRMPLKGRAYSGDVVLGAMAVNWRAEGAVRAGFNTAPSRIDMKFAEHVVPIAIRNISGTMDLGSTWHIAGGFSGGSAQTEEASLADAGGKFDLDGARGSVNGQLTNVAMRLFDPQPEDKRRYEEAKFTGSAGLDDGIASFSGLFTLAKKGVQIASITGTHDLETGAGSLTFTPTPLIFLPRSFQPYDLSPVLRGPANVTGRVDISGGASWSAKGFNANATMDLRKLGFSIASAGIFEGVSGKVEVSDLTNMKSAPGQTITIDKVTLGLPIEKGAIKFQLIGFSAIRLEGAEWPFVGGFIRVKPADFRFDALDNRIIAQAVDWDLNKIVELFKVPDLKLNGIVNGDIPMVFSTGSARIDKADLEASSKGGFIQYTGSTGDAAAESDSNAKMLFDALKDFRYKVLKVGLDGDIADRIVLSLNLLGANPTVLNGKAFQLNISVDSPLMDLLNMTSWQDQMKAQITKAPAPD